MIFNRLLLDPDEIIQRVVDSINKKEPLLLTYLNQHCFNIYCVDGKYKQLLDTKYEVFQADLGISLAIKFLKIRKVKRIDATAMNEMILNKFIRENIPLTIVGGNFEQDFVRKKADEKAVNLFSYFNGHFKDAQSDKIIKELDNLNCQAYIIGMGVPLQELFAEKLSKVSNSKVIICVGNFLEFYFGTKKRAPFFFREIGIEWIFRLITEPRRLWKRYLIGIPVFIYRILKIKFSSTLSL